MSVNKLKFTLVKKDFIKAISNDNDELVSFITKNLNTREKVNVLFNLVKYKKCEMCKTVLINFFPTNLNYAWFISVQYCILFKDLTFLMFLKSNFKFHFIPKILEYACEIGCLEIIKYIVGESLVTDISFLNCIENNDLEAVKLLCEYSKSPYNSLKYCIEDSNYETAEYILSKYYNSDNQMSYSLYDALCTCLLEKNMKMTQLLIETYNVKLDGTEDFIMFNSNNEEYIDFLMDNKGVLNINIDIQIRLILNPYLLNYVYLGYLKVLNYYNIEIPNEFYKEITLYKTVKYLLDNVDVTEKNLDVLYFNTNKLYTENNIKIRKVIQEYISTKFVIKESCGGDYCLICLDVIEDDNYILLSCNHRFHTVCINTWYTVNESCPSCRKRQRS